jgi:DNA-binding PadR family transcriptional regulator
MGALPRDWLVACLLLRVREDGASGRDLIEEMRDLGFGSVRPGEMYRTLRELKSEGLVAWEGRDAEYMLSRRRYTITAGLGLLRDLHDLYIMRAPATSPGP